MDARNTRTDPGFAPELDLTQEIWTEIACQSCGPVATPVDQNARAGPAAG
jgi:hypothetical protein